MSDIDKTTDKITDKKPMKSAKIALLGRPNVGKSTLLNAILGTEVTATSPRPQTTRDNTLGIYQSINSDGAWDAELAFVDAPGVDLSRGLLARSMHASVENALCDVDIVLWIVDCRHALKDFEDMELEKSGEDRVAEWLGKKLSYSQGKHRWVLGLSKVDLISKNKLLPIMEKINKTYPQFEKIVPFASLLGSDDKNSNLETLINVLKDMAPAGEAKYTQDEWTDTSERKLIKNFVMESIFRTCNDEVPYGCDCSVNDFIEAEPPYKKHDVSATIWVTRKSLKPIMIGAQGSRIKMIGSYARKKFKDVTGNDIVLRLNVKVVEKWEQNSRYFEELGYGRQ